MPYFCKIRWKTNQFFKFLHAYLNFSVLMYDSGKGTVIHCPNEAFLLQL
jgi:hypothetical protein